MASLSKETRNGEFVGWRVMWYDSSGKRQQIRLGKVSKTQANRVALLIEKLLAAKTLGVAPDPETTRWLEEIGQPLADRLAKVGLMSPRSKRTIKQICEAYLANLVVKPASRLAVEQAVRDLLQYFGPDRDVAGITPGDAEDFKAWLLRRKSLREKDGRTLSPATVGKRIQSCRAIFRYAVKHQIIHRNPFTDIRLPKADVTARQRYIPVDVVEKLIEVAPSAEWRLLLAMARYLGVRVPSEPFSMTWEDVDWENRRLRIPSPKTATSGKSFRVVPLLPRVEQLLSEVWEEAEEGNPYIFAKLRQRDSIKAAERGFWAKMNLRQELLRLCRKAMIEPWPRLWQNLRSSAETDFSRQFPIHVAAAWLGNTQRVAVKHYLQVTDADYQRAIECGAKSGAMRREMRRCNDAQEMSQ